MSRSVIARLFYGSLIALVVAASTIRIIVGASIAQLVGWIAMLVYLLTGLDARLAPPVGAGPATAWSRSAAPSDSDGRPARFPRP